ncbi:metal-dependent hydrolase [Roseibium aestuarii]|uniref:Metal-dependent hydrolase n=1 Tax=Roseibium aestuarii TaxID=2600299 RepID=A0ABW4JSK6_9HYPH|nr:metal-dependent hydrolase [Roseibium aestuarii]
MDSLTQFVLGAAVSTVVLGPKMGPRKAAILGGVLGTLPDLDVFLPFDDPVDSFVYHRGWTHSLVIHALAAPVIGEALVRLVRPLRTERVRTWLAVFLCLSTHALLDAMTIYGTRLFWPLYPDPVGAGSVFIIDPLYTLPLLGVVLWSLSRRHWSKALGRAVSTALIFSTGYLALGLGLQAHIEARARVLFREAGVEPEKVLAIAGPFNTVLWKVIALESDTYHNLYLSLLDTKTPPQLYSHPRRSDLAACLEGTEPYEKLVWFSHGFLKAEERDGAVVVSDLRMGMTPDYVFRFALAEIEDGRVNPVEPRRAAGTRVMAEGDGDWLVSRLLGRAVARPAEPGPEVPTEKAPLRCPS